MTNTEFENPILRQLAKAFPQQAKNWDGGSIHIQLDDRDRDDSYAGFCNIHLEMVDPKGDQFVLILDNVPFDEDVEQLVEQLSGIWGTTKYGRILSIPLTIKDSGKINRMATAIERVVGRGKRYSEPNWKWIAHRTGGSLRLFASRLRQCRSERSR